MNYNFNPGFPYGWTPSSSFIPNPFSPNTSAAATPVPTPHATPTSFNINPAISSGIPGQPSVSGSIQGFNDPGYGGMRFPGGIFPFGLNAPYNGNLSNNQSAPFCGNWNYGFQDSVNRFNVPQQANIPSAMSAVPLNEANNGANNGQVKNENSVSLSGDNSSQDISGNNDIARKVTSLLCESDLFKTAITKIQEENGNGTDNTQIDQSDLDDSNDSSDTVVGSPNLSSATNDTFR